MYTYRPIHVTAKGEILPGQPDTNALGVFEGETLRAVYIHDPTRTDRIKAHIYFYVFMAAALALLLGFVNKVDSWSALPLVLGYLGFSWLMMWALILPDTTVRPDAQLIKSALYLTHGKDIDIVVSRKRLLKEYPSVTQHP